MKHSSGYVAPQTDVEQQIADIWAEILCVERVGRHDNFFELGGHSLLVARVISRIRATLDVDLSVSVLFESPTVAGVAEHLEAVRWSKEGVVDPESGYTEFEL